MVNCNNQCGWLQLPMRLDISNMSLFSNCSLAGKTSGFKRPGSITNPNCGLPATGYPASHPYAVCPYIIPRAICQIPCHTPHVQVPLDYQLPATVYPAAACHGVPCTIHHIPTYPGTDSHGPLAPKEGAGT